MTFVDAHAHLDYKDFNHDLDEVINRAKKAGVTIIVNNGLNPESNRQTIELAKKYDVVKASLGLYPIDALKMSDSEIDAEISFIKKQKLIAIGEVGLDYHWDKDNHERQKNIFRKIITLAKKLDVPLIVHSRDAEKDTISILEEEGAKKVVLHCFNGDLELIKKAENLRYYFSVPGIVTFTEHFQNLTKQVNINLLLTETDCPFMSPHRGKRNEPSFVVENIKKIAEIKGFDAKEVENNILMNYKRLFE